MDELVIFDKIANFFIARTESIRKVNWDNKVKLAVHADFFTRAKGILVTAYYDKFKILHAQTPFDKHYMSKRMNTENDIKYLRRKYSVEKVY